MAVDEFEQVGDVISLGTLFITYDTNSREDAEQWASELLTKVRGRIAAAHPILSLFYEINFDIEDVIPGSQTPKSNWQQRLRRWAQDNPVITFILGGMAGGPLGDVGKDVFEYTHKQVQEWVDEGWAADPKAPRSIEYIGPPRPGQEPERIKFEWPGRPPEYREDDSDDPSRGGGATSP